jgi:hypothetical protein
MVDLQYADLRPARSLHRRLVAASALRTLADEAEIRAAVATPPRATRAWTRGNLVGRHGDRVAGAAPAGVKVPQPALLHALKEAGWVDLGRVASGDFQSKKHMFCAPEMAGRPKSELRRMVEDIPAPMAVRLVK